MEFFLRLLEALAIPAALVAAAFILRPAISSISSREENPRSGMDFREAMLALQKKAETLQPRAGGHSSLAERRLLKLAETSPRTAVFEAWHGVEAAARDAVRRQESVAKGPSGTAVRIGDALFLSNLLDAESFEIFNDLRRLRNTALHENNIESCPDEVRDYINFSFLLVRCLADRVETGRRAETKKERHS
jgi:hypothetical protein